MIYDTSIPASVTKARDYLEHLITLGDKIEILKKRDRRTISQNNYLHLILTWYAIEYGDTLQYIKQDVFKKVVNYEIFRTEFINRKTGEIREAFRSTADLNTKELATAIDRFRTYSATVSDIYLPEPNDMAAINNMEAEISNNDQKFI